MAAAAGRPEDRFPTRSKPIRAKEPITMSTFLAYTSPATGHAFPLVPGLNALRARGHSVQLRTAPELVDQISATGLDACPLDPRVCSIPVDDHLAGGGRQRLTKGFERLLSRGEHERED